MGRWKTLARRVVAMVPSWCEAQTNHRLPSPDKAVSLGAAGDDITVYSLHLPSDELKALYEKAGSLLLSDYKRLSKAKDEASSAQDDLLDIMVEADVSDVDVPPNASDIEGLTRELALFWLNKVDGSVEWESLFAYLDLIRYRTHENDAVSVTLIIDTREKKRGSGDITEKRHQKVFDMIATSQETFLVVDRYMQFLDYSEQEAVSSNDQFLCAPRFTTRKWTSVPEGGFLVEKTRRGDILISQPGAGLVASWRKGFWYVYERGSLQTIFEDVFGDLGSGVLDLVFDLSYKRHGALLVYDPDLSISTRRLSNPESLISRISKDRDDAHSILGRVIRSARVGNADDSLRNVLAEAASMDGAVLFNDKKVRAFGAMIVTRRGIGSRGGGARTAAMHSARSYGALPIKISADGEVTLLYPSPVSSDSGDIEIEFA